MPKIEIDIFEDLRKNGHIWEGEKTTLWYHEKLDGSFTLIALYDFEDKKRIFDEYIIPFLPCNVEVEWHDNPVKYFYFFAGTANENNSQFEFCVYGDDFDISKNFPEPTREKYFGDLYRSGRLKFKGISRYLTSPISATQMRYFIANNMRNEFLYNLPEEIRHIDIWNILRRRWEEENLCAEEDFVVDYLLKGFNVE